MWLHYFKSVTSIAYHFKIVVQSTKFENGYVFYWACDYFPDSKVHGANMGPIWGRQDPGGSHVGPMNLAIWVTYARIEDYLRWCTEPTSQRIKYVSKENSDEF